MESDIKPPVVEPVVDSLVHFDSLETTERQDEEIQIPRRVLDDFIRLLEEQRSTLLNFRMEMDNGIGNMLLKRRDVQRSEGHVQNDTGSETINNHDPQKLRKAMENNYTKDERGLNSSENYHTKNNTFNFTENTQIQNEQWSDNNDFTKFTYAIVKDDILRNIAMIENEISIIENDDLEIDSIMKKDYPENDTRIIGENDIGNDKPMIEKGNTVNENLIIEKDNPVKGIPMIIVTEAEEKTHEDEDATAISPNDYEEDVPFSKSKKRRLRKKRKLQEIKVKKLEKLAKRAALELIAEDANEAAKTEEIDVSVTDKKQKTDATVEEEENEVANVKENTEHAVVVRIETGNKICLEKTAEEDIVEEKEMPETEGSAILKENRYDLIVEKDAVGRSVVGKEAERGLFSEKTERHVTKDEIENQMNFLREAIEEMANAEKKNKREISPEVMVATAVFNYMMKKVGEKFKTPEMERVQDIIFLLEYFNMYMMILLYSILFYKVIFSIFCAC